MRIDGWHIDGYGVHADLHVTDLTGGLTIVAGPNESGKTTLQHFLVGMLFGFPAVTKKEEHHPPLRGGTFGGRLFVTTDDGDHLTIHRSKARSSLKVTHADGSPFDGDLTQVVGGATRELFESIFAVRLDSLTELRALTEDQVRDRVFSAGILGAGRSAQAALAQLSTERDALLKPSGRGERYRIKELRSQLTEARLRLDEARRESQALPAHVRQMELLAERAQTLGTRADGLRAQRTLVIAVTELWPRWSAATDARHQLDQLGPVPDLTADAPAQIHTAIERHRAADDAAVRAADERTGADAHLASLDAPVLDLDAIDRIERLARQIEPERDRAQRIEELRARAAHQHAELERELSILGDGRDLAWLATRPVGAVDAAGLRQAAAAVAEARADRRDAARAQDQLTTDLSAEAAQLDHDEASLAELPTLRPADAAAGVDAANALAALTTQRELAARRLEEAEARRAAALAAPPSPSGTASGLVAVGAIAAVAGLALLVLGQPVAGAALIAIATAAGAAGLAARSRVTTSGSTADLDAVIELADGDLHRIDADLISPLAVLRLDATPSASEAAGIRAHAERLASAAQQAHDQRARVASDRRRHQERTARLGTAAAQRVAATAVRVVEAEQAWAAWLEEHDLPAGLDPTGAADHLGAIDRAQSAARHLALTESDLATQRAGADAFAEAVRSLHADLPALGTPDGDVLTVLDRLATRAAGQRALLLQIADASAAAERAERAERRAVHHRSEAAQQLAAARSTIGATTNEEALATLERADTAARLCAIIDDADARLDAAVGASPESRSAATALLAAADPGSWSRQASELSRLLAETTEDRDQCLHDQAVVRAEVDRLVASADVPTCELRVAGIEAELVEAVTSWASLSLAHQMVEGTLARYQRERQPDVVKRAASLFTHVTGGHYDRLEIRDNDVFAIDHTEREVPAHRLSQGAREQLYLCMRVALAESFAKTTALPLLLDDITVNADAGRQQQLNELLATVSDTQQVFAFTCHDDVVAQLQALRPDATVLTLEAHRTAHRRTPRMGAVS